MKRKFVEIKGEQFEVYKQVRFYAGYVSSIYDALLRLPTCKKWDDDVLTGLDDVCKIEYCHTQEDYFGRRGMAKVTFRGENCIELSYWYFRLLVYFMELDEINGDVYLERIYECVNDPQKKVCVKSNEYHRRAKNEERTDN